MMLSSLLAPTRALPRSSQGRSYALPQRSSTLALSNGASRLWTKQQRHRFSTARSAGPSGDGWEPVVTNAIKDLRSDDPQLQIEGVKRLERLCRDNPDAMEDLAYSGAVEALTDAAVSGGWNVKSEAVTVLGNLSILSLDIGAAVPSEQIVPVLVDMLRQLATMSEKEWQDLGEGLPDRSLVHCEVLALLSALAVHNANEEHKPPLAVPVDVVPLMVDLLDEHDEDRILAVTAAQALATLASTTPTIQDAVSKSVAIDKIGAWLSTGVARLVVPAARALGRMAFNEQLRDVLDEKGIFGKLMITYINSNRNQDAMSSALNHWDEDELDKAFKKYTGGK